ncbi:MAG: alpha-ribazole phosphatase [Clostridia bacterium]|nr:alpha-ribazole phosphatase [Clostridia bacterium]
MKEFIFIRHGETESNKKGTYLGSTDIELNEEGLRQAAIVANKLSGEQVEKIFSSPLKRAFRTAEIINQVFGLDIICSEALSERNFGVWDNLTYEEIQIKFPIEHSLWVKDWINYAPLHGESAVMSYERARSFVLELKQMEGEGKYIIVSHSGAIRNMLVVLLDLKLEDVWRFKIQNGGITRVQLDQNYAVLHLLNG